MQRKESVIYLLWRFVYPVLLMFAADIAVEFVFMMVYGAVNIGSGALSAADSEALSEELIKGVSGLGNVMTIVRCAIVIPVSLLLMKKDKQRDWERGEYVEYSPYDKRFLIVLPFAGFAAAMAFNHIVPMIVMALQSLVRNISGKDIDMFASFNAVSEHLYSGAFVLQLLTSSVLAPVCEELIFRGLLYRRLRGYLKMIPSMLISALIFGLIHGNIVQFFYAFIIGLFLSYVYEKFKTVWACVIFHAGANLISIIVTAIMGGEQIGITSGSYMLLIVVELAVAFLLLWLVERKVNRVPMEKDAKDSN